MQILEIAHTRFQEKLRDSPKLPPHILTPTICPKRCKCSDCIDEAVQGFYVGVDLSPLIAGFPVCIRSQNAGLPAKLTEIPRFGQ